MMEQLSLSNIKLSPVERDICARKHGGVDTSVAADKRVQKERDRNLILAYIKAARDYGITLDEMCIQLERKPNEISGRFSELRNQEQIVATSRRRLTRTGATARVWVAL
jgi:hypothetical protein